MQINQIGFKTEIPLDINGFPTAKGLLVATTIKALQPSIVQYKRINAQFVGQKKITFPYEFLDRYQ